MGAAVTPGNLTYGTPVQLVGSASATGVLLTTDCLELTVVVNNVAINATAHDALTGLLVDDNGGTSYRSLADLLCGSASGYVTANVGMVGVVYTFQIWIRSGASIAVAGMVNSANVTAFNAFCRVKGAPVRPWRVPFVGTFIDQYGVNLATAAGTTVVPGAAADGTPVLLGTIARTCYAWEVGYGINNANMTGATIDVDVMFGNGTTFRQGLVNVPFATSANEAVSKPAAANTLVTGVAGDSVYARSQSSAAAIAGNSVAAYGVGS